jgi:predicted TIM-barrel fold metal-dependent hydrolase/fido (protein-threonine AMPylation protein)
LAGFGIINVHEHIDGIACVPKLLEAMQRNHVLRTVLVGTSGVAATQINSEGRQEDKSNAEVLRIAKIYPEYFIPFVAVCSGSHDPMAVHRHLERSPMGFEIRRGDPNDRESALDRRSLISLYEFCERHRVPIIFHIKLEHYKDELEGTLRRFRKLKAMCSLLGRSELALERADHLLRSYPNLYTDTSIGETDLVDHALPGYSPNSDKFRALVLTYQDRILFGTCNTSTASRKTAVCETRKIRAHRDLLEKNTCSCAESQEKWQVGLHLDANVLRKIYCTNAESFLEMPETKENVSPWRSAGRRHRDVLEKVNSSRVSDFITESLGRSRPVNEDFLFSLNRLVLEDFAEHYRSRGHYRKTSVVIRRMGNVVHVPPKATDIPLLMKQLLSTIELPLGQSSVGHAAQVFLRLQEIHPFYEGNGRTGRAVATYLLRQSGLREKRGRSLEQYFDSNIEDCYDTLYQSRNGDPLPWLLFFAEAVESVMSDKGSMNGALSALTRRLRQRFRRS